MLKVIGTVSLSIAAMASGGNLLLPERRDIPADFSAVICPSETQARRFLSDYIVQGPNLVDTASFMNGLRVTGCEQRSGPLQIEAVLERKTLVAGPITYMLYKARRPSGAIVYGTIDETGNNNHPRTPYEAWLRLNTQDGYVSDATAEKRMYLCRSPQSARAVVAAIPPYARGTQHAARQVQVKSRALQANSCVVARGRFRVEEIHNKVTIITGFEAGEEWYALTATNAQGRTVGLLFDVSQH